jgi:hypothetical protein
MKLFGLFVLIVIGAAECCNTKWGWKEAPKRDLWCYECKNKPLDYEVATGKFFLSLFQFK